MRAAAWTVLQKGASDALRMAGSLILTRILFPEAFGLMATVTTVLVMIQLFADTGVQLSIIQNPHGAEPEFLNTAWIISIGRGLILCGVIAAAAWPVSILYKDPALMPLFFIMAVDPLIIGFENPAIVLLVKNFRIEKKFVLDFTTQLLGLIASITLAYSLKSVIALACGAVFASLVRVLGSYIIQPYSPKFIWNKTHGSELFSFGKFVFVNTIITWFALNADVLIIGKLLGMETLGVYQIGRNIGNVVPLFFMGIMAQAYMPAASSVSGDIARICGMYNRVCAFVLALIVPTAMSVAFFSHDIIGFLYDPRYQGAFISVSWFVLSGIFLVLGSAASNTFFAMGCPKYQTMSSLLGLIVVLILVPLGIFYKQMLGAAFAMFCVVVIISIAQNFYLINTLKFPLKAVAKPWLQLILTGSFFSGVFIVLRSMIAGERINHLALIALAIITGFAISFAIYILMEGPRPFKDRGSH